MENFKYIKNALHEDACKSLTDWLLQCIKNKKATHDPQCPSSWSVGHDSVSDKVLDEFLTRMEQETGKKLFPTYAYARHYKKGEVLKCHTDRPACEYSATITLGHDGEVWPFWVADSGNETDQGIVGEKNEIYRIKNTKELKIQIGDAVIYKGMELPHWREELKNEWQTQIFLHYVDQDGPHAEWKYDTRDKLTHHGQAENFEQILYWYVPNAVADVSCDQMMQKFGSKCVEKASIGFSKKTGSINSSVRDVNTLEISHELGIGATLTGMGMNINQQAWQFAITNSDQSEYLKYDVDGHYQTHVDTFYMPNSNRTRKLTILAFLNDDFEGGKFYLDNGNQKIYPEQDKGTSDL